MKELVLWTLLEERVFVTLRKPSPDARLRRADRKTEIKADSERWDMFTADTQSYPQALRAYLQYSLLIAANFIVYFN